MTTRIDTAPVARRIKHWMSPAGAAGGTTSHAVSLWVLLYVERWLKAPVSMPDGTLTRPEKGTPQGSVVSFVLANLFLHWAFDRWMAEKQSDIPFERYADDAICHCRSEEQALALPESAGFRVIGPP